MARIKTFDVTQSGSKTGNLKVIAGRAIRESGDAALELHKSGHPEVAERVAAAGIESASALEVYDAEAKGK